MPSHTPSCAAPARGIYATCSGDEPTLVEQTVVDVRPVRSVRSCLPSWLACVAAVLTGFAGGWSYAEGFWPASILAAPVLVIWLVVALDSATSG